jgi:putative lipoic acid-binding regulatory protein
VSECQQPAETYPTRVPMKIIGRAAELKPEAVAALIFQHLRSAPAPAAWQEELQFSARPKGQWISYTFWVTLPDEHTERPLREAIQQLPGVVMQL